VIYFAPEAEQRYATLGITGRMGYFASRGAALGAVPADVIIATFFNFSPALVRSAIPAAWDIAAPRDIVAARMEVADAVLRRILGSSVGAEGTAEAAGLARRAAEAACEHPEGRPLFAAHAALDWPDEPHLVLWHAVTLLREHRGDAHLHALLSAGLSGIEALITHVATGRGFTVEFAQQSRGWSPEQWGEASARLVERGLLDGDGGLTAAGATLRAEIEDHTTRMSLAPWRHLGAEGAARLAEVSRPLSKAVLPAFAIDGVFAPASPRRV
jgi:hypothetical protein